MAKGKNTNSFLYTEDSDNTRRKNNTRQRSGRTQRSAVSSARKAQTVGMERSRGIESKQNAVPQQRRTAALTDRGQRPVSSPAGRRQRPATAANRGQRPTGLAEHSRQAQKTKPPQRPSMRAGQAGERRPVQNAGKSRPSAASGQIKGTRPADPLSARPKRQETQGAVHSAASKQSAAGNRRQERQPANNLGRSRQQEPVVFGAEEKAKMNRRPPRERIPAAGEKWDRQKKGKMLNMAHEGRTGADEKKARKISKKPKMDPKKKRKIIFWIILLVIVVGSLLFGAFKIMRVREVKFRGLTNVTEEYAKGLSGVKKGTHIFNVDMSTIEKNINSDPYLVYENTTYVFPDKLVIDVNERQERASIAIASSFVVIDENCVILKQTEAGEKTDAAQIIGLEISEFTPGYELRSTDTYKQDTLKYILNALVYSGMIDSISQINIIDVNDMRLTTKEGMEIVLGQKENAPEKLLLARSVINYLAKEGKTEGTLDVTTDGQASYMAAANTILPNPTDNDNDAVKDGDSAEPTSSETPKPENTAKPSETAKPEDGAKPSETAKPEDSAKPSETAKPEDSAKPSETAQPEDSAEPNSSAQPSEVPE